MDIYLVIGQSNMAGRAEIESPLKDTLSNVYLFKGEKDDIWVPAVNPFNLYSTIRKEVAMQKLSPAYQFAKVLSENNPENSIGLVVNVRGGTALSEWMPGTHYYQEVIRRSKLATQDGAIKGIIWHQGESDVNKIDGYLPNLQILIESLRKDLENSKIPFIAGQLLNNNPQRQDFNAMILKLPQIVPNTAVVSSAGTYSFDGTHFDSKSQLLLGERYAGAMLDQILWQEALFSFGLFADTQYADIETLGKRNYRGSIKILENTVQKFNQYELSRIINLGDLIDRDFVSFEKPLNILKKSRLPIIHVFGNHDFTVEDGMKRKVPALLENPRGYHSFEKEGFLFIILNGMDISLEAHKAGSKKYKLAEKKLAELNATGANNAKAYNGGLGAKQLVWLEKQLQSAEKKGLKTLIFCHFPLLPENGLQLWDHQNMIDMLTKYSTVKAYFSGHHHEGNYVVDQGIHYLTVKGMVESLAESSGYIVYVFPNQLVLKGMGEQENLEMDFLPE